MNSVNRSAVYVHEYSAADPSPKAVEVIKRANRDVRVYGNSQHFARFSAKWVMVATWVRLRPFNLGHVMSTSPLVSVLGSCLL